MVACPMLFGIELFYVAGTQRKSSWLLKIPPEVKFIVLCSRWQGTASLFSEAAKFILSFISSEKSASLYKIMKAQIIESIVKYKLCSHTISLS